MKGSYYTDMELKQLNIIQSVIDKKRTGKIIIPLKFTLNKKNQNMVKFI